MMQRPVPENLRSSGLETPMAAEGPSINARDAIRILRSAGGALLTQTALHGRLAKVEWAQEKNRLLMMFVVILLGFACLLCLMLFTGALLLTLCWETPLRIPAAIVLITAYALGIHLAWRRFQSLSALSAQTFAGTREEFAADIALLKSNL